MEAKYIIVSVVKSNKPSGKSGIGDDLRLYAVIDAGNDGKDSDHQPKAWNVLQRDIQQDGHPEHHPWGGVPYRFTTVQRVLYRRASERRVYFPQRFQRGGNGVPLRGNDR